MSADPRAVEVAAALDPVVTAAGFDLDEVTLSRAGRRTVVRVSIDAEHGVGLDAAAEVSRLLDPVLDQLPALGTAPFTLEVSSRGVGAPLVLPRHWRRNVGRLVAVTTTAGTSVTGRIATAGDTAATLELEDSDDRTEIPYGSVRRAVVTVEFNRRGAGPAAADDAADNTAQQGADKGAGTTDEEG